MWWQLQGKDTGMDGTQWLPLWNAQSGLAGVQRRSYRKRWIELSEDYISIPSIGKHT